MWPPHSLLDRVLCSWGAPPRGAAAFIGTNRHMQRQLAFVAAGASGGWTCCPVKRRLAVNRPILWRLRQPPLHVAAGCRAMWSRHYRRLKRRLQDLSPFGSAASYYRHFKRRFETSFEKISNGYLFSKNHRNIYISRK
jgi:hypothetical protein